LALEKNNARKQERQTQETDQLSLRERRSDTPKPKISFLDHEGKGGNFKWGANPPGERSRKMRTHVLGPQGKTNEEGREGLKGTW